MASPHDDGIAAEVLHEIKQPLMGLKAWLQMVRDEPTRQLPIDVLLQQVDRIEQIVQDFHRLSNEQPPPTEPVKLSAVVTEAMRQFNLVPAHKTLSIDVQVVFDVELQANQRLLEQLVINLLGNARDALKGKGKIKVVVTRESLKPALYVADWGSGIPKELRERVFEPWVTTKGNKGTGLGLAICKRIVREHGGVLDLAPPELIGELPAPATVFRVVFQQAGKTARAGEARRKVLIVDDESVIRRLFVDLLQRDCDVSDAETAEQALELLKAQRFDLLLSDKNLPGISGLELAQQARKTWPELKVMLMTGYPSVVTAQQAVELGLLDYLVKPFDDIRAVREKVKNALQPSPASSAVHSAPVASSRVDIYEDNPLAAKAVSDAVTSLGFEPRIISTATPGGTERPAAVVLSWDFAPAHGLAGIQMVKRWAENVPFVVLAEHLTMDAALESLRGGALACLPKLLTDVKALARELQRALKLPERSK